MPIKICAIVAMDKNRVIGLNNQLPWKLPEDLRRFSALTTGHTVLMGRKTYQSLPSRFRPLPQRKNVVATRSTAQKLLLPKEVELCASPTDYLQSCKEGKVSLPSDQVWVIGGAEIYAATQHLWDEIYVTRIDKEHEGDAFFPDIEGQFELRERHPREGFAYEIYARRAVQQP